MRCGERLLFLGTPVARGAFAPGAVIARPVRTPVVRAAIVGAAVAAVSFVAASTAPVALTFLPGVLLGGRQCGPFFRGKDLRGGRI